MEKMELGRMIAAKRDELRETQEEFGARFGVTQQAVFNWENGLSSPKKQILLKICTLLGIEYKAAAQRRGKKQPIAQPVLTREQLCQLGTISGAQKYAIGCQKIANKDVGKKLLESIFYLAEHDEVALHIVLGEVLKLAREVRSGEGRATEELKVKKKQA